MKNDIAIPSDFRLKKNITPLSADFCKRFVTNTTPVSFNWKIGDDGISYGYIAQDLMRNGFDELISISDDSELNYQLDPDGFIHPDGIKFSVAYSQIIPILAMNQKHLLEENKMLHRKIDNLIQIVEQLTGRYPMA